MKLSTFIVACAALASLAACTNTEVKPEATKTAHITNIRVVVLPDDSNKVAPSVMPTEYKQLHQ